MNILKKLFGIQSPVDMSQPVDLKTRRELPPGEYTAKVTNVISASEGGYLVTNEIADKISNSFHNSPLRQYLKESPTQLDPGLLPDSVYTAHIVNHEVKNMRSGRGQYIKFVFVITKGEFKGKTLFSNVILTHEKKTVEDIGLSNLSKITKACRLNKVSNTRDFHLVPMTIRVSTMTQPTFPPHNIITDFKPI